MLISPTPTHVQRQNTRKHIIHTCPAASALARMAATSWAAIIGFTSARQESENNTTKLRDDEG